MREKKETEGLSVLFPAPAHDNSWSVIGKGVLVGGAIVCR